MSIGLQPGTLQGTGLISPGRLGSWMASTIARKPAVAAGAGVLAALVAIDLLAPVIEPYSVWAQVGPVYGAPSSSHWLGLDDGGIDMLSLLIEGARISLLVGLSASLIAIGIGAVIGLIAGYYGGALDIALMRLTDLVLVVPAVPLMILIAATWGPSLAHVILVIGVLFWTGTARIVRSQVQSLRQRIFVRRVSALGASDLRIVLHHILPHVGPLLIATTVINIANAVFAETALAFLGLSDPSAISWGSLIAHAFARTAVSVGAWWAIVPPGACVAILIMSCYLVGQGVEEALNPRLKVAHISANSFRALPTRATAPSSALLSVRDISVRFELTNGRTVQAVDSVSLDIGRGERAALVGESGSGKTTTVLTVMGLLPPNATVRGELWFGNQEMLAAGEEGFRKHRWKDIAMVFQSAMNALNPVRTVGQQIVEPMQTHEVASGAAARRRALELLAMVGMPATAFDAYPHEFSGGMRQRAAIAMALACGPRVLIADEPTTALDVMVQAQVLELLVRLCEDLGLALLLVTHDLAVVSQVCSTAAVMYAGRIVEQGTVATIFTSPRHPYTRLLLAATPSLHGGRRGAFIPGVPPRLDAPIIGCPFQPRCDVAFGRCTTERPLLVTLQADQKAACHLNDLGAVAVSRARD